MTALLGVALLAWMAAATPIAAEETPRDRAGDEFFEKNIRPLLVAHCYECHSAEGIKRSGRKMPGGGLLLDTRDGLRDGGDIGPAVVAGKPDESLIVKAVRYDDKDLKMPPAGKLPAAAIASLEAWVKMGAPDPRVAGSAAATAAGATWPDVLRQRRTWWSLQPVRKPVVPAVKNAAWSSHPVDRFILAKLEARGLAPAEPADHCTLVRRLSLVLTGLPPTPEEGERFVGRIVNPSEKPGQSGRIDNPSYEDLVDRLLASPHFGERWARHWMDIVRFSETHGNEWNYEVHHAWRYRDYLIRALNDDVPYDQLVREHVAGDLLANPRWNQAERFNESVIGTAFYRFGEVNHDDCISLPQIGFDIADNQIDTLSKAFLATTVACARCHDHKLDAVSMRDYYSMLGVLRSSRLVSHTIDAPDAQAESLAKLRALKQEIRKELGVLWLREARDVGRYLLAATAARGKQADAAELARGLEPARLERWAATMPTAPLPLEAPLAPWWSIVEAKPADAATLQAAWGKLVDRYAQEQRQRAEFNAKHFTTLVDFRQGGTGDWQSGGYGLRGGTSRGGDFALRGEGEVLVRAILPAGIYTHALSDRLNGTLRSPPLAATKKHISFQVVGQRSSAVRLVSNNCQLNYKNYRALTSDEPQWVTFELPEDASALRVYAELMTMLDNPKFPDQLSALGGDKENYRLPWEKAAANPRSHWGMTRVVLHDGPEPPKAELGFVMQLAAPKTAPDSLADLAARYAQVVELAIKAWAEDRATDDDARWLDALLQQGLLSNGLRMSPRVKTLSAQYRRIEAGLSSPRIVPGLADCGPGFEQPVFVRGDCTKPGEPAPRRFLEVLSTPNERFNRAGSGRLDLAERIASPDNPLTARVMVNRVWHHLFGAGLVRTVDDFGHVGDLPSHPELLDYLAAEFAGSPPSSIGRAAVGEARAWSLKRLIRTLVLTRTFQMAHRPDESQAAAVRTADPANRLLHHYPARRLEAEAIRDSILAVSGRLDPMLFGTSIQPYRQQEYPDRRLFAGPLDGHGRRSVYIKNNLMESPSFLGVFNFPGGKFAQGRRDVTNVPAQALALLNDPFVHAQAAVWAEQLTARRDPSVAARVDHLFAAALGRAPSAAERERFVEAARQLAARDGAGGGDVLTRREVWKDLAHAIFNLAEFCYIP